MNLKLHSRLILPLIVPLIAGALPALTPLPAGDDVAAGAISSITSAELRSIVGFLASDQMEGRQTGTQSNHLAALYLAHQLELLGLDPAGGDGTFLQDFQLTQSQIVGDNRFEVVLSTGTPASGVLMETFFPLPISASGEVEAQAVPVSAELAAEAAALEGDPQLSGRIAVMLAGDPFEERGGGPGSREPAVSGDRARILAAQRQGAVGVVLVEPGRGNGWLRLIRAHWPGDSEWSGFQLADAAETVRIPVLVAARSLVEPWFSEQIAGAASDPETARKAASRQSGPVILRLRTELAQKQTPSLNVLARLDGSDPLLRHEVVVVSAHLDHVGMTDNRIFNGADDNASGTAAVLEIAEAFVLSAARPRRSVVFALWNAEEHGLLGSRYFVESPSVPLSRIRAVFQMDMIGRDQEVPDREDPRFRGMAQQSSEQNRNTVHLVGYSYSDHLRGVVERAGSQVGLDLLMEFDHHPLTLVKRSDSWPFLQRGIPAALISTGLHPDYHTPNDRPELLNYPKMERIARMVFLAAWEAADGTGPLELNQVM